MKLIKSTLANQQLTTMQMKINVLYTMINRNADPYYKMKNPIKSNSIYYVNEDDEDDDDDMPDLVSSSDEEEE